MLGKLGKWLRLLGFDAPCRPLAGVLEIEAYETEGRIPVTRNQRWCSHKGVLCLTSNEPAAQLRELLLELEIQPEEINFLSRCVACNQRLEGVSRNAVLGLVPDYVYDTSPVFSRCSVCGKVYWYGSHPGRMVERFQRLVEGTWLEGWAPGITKAQ